MKKILVLCTGNSCRSQMAEGYLRQFGADNFQIYSAGIETHGLNPMAVEVMAEDGIDISNHLSNNLTEYLNIDFDFIITVCNQANDNCPYIPGDAIRFHQNFSDPAKALGSKQQILDEFRAVRDQIREYSARFVTAKI